MSLSIQPVHAGSGEQKDHHSCEISRKSQVREQVQSRLAVGAERFSPVVALAMEFEVGVLPSCTVIETNRREAEMKGADACRWGDAVERVKPFSF